MKKNLTVDNICRVANILVCSLMFISCTSYMEDRDVTSQTSDKFTSYASDSDTIVINSISLFYTNKRFYGGDMHANIGLSYELAIHNRNKAAMTLTLRDSSGNSDIYAIYQQDTVGWLSYNNKTTLQIPPEQSGLINVTNVGILGGAFYIWEPNFIRQEDYTADMLALLPNVKVYYNGQIVLPSKNVTITTSDYKNGWIIRCIARLSGQKYRQDIEWNKN